MQPHASDVFYTVYACVCLCVFVCGCALWSPQGCSLLALWKTKYPLLFFSFLPSFLCLFQSQLMAQSALLNTCISGNTWEFICLCACVCVAEVKKSLLEKQSVWVSKFFPSHMCVWSVYYMYHLIVLTFFSPLKQNLHTTFTPAHTHTHTYTVTVMKCENSNHLTKAVGWKLVIITMIIWRN